MTIKNAGEAQTYKEERFAKVQLFREGKSTAFMLNFMPGQSFPPHPHPNAHVYLFVVEGSGKCIIDGQEHAIIEKDVIHCYDKQIVSIENDSNQQLSIYVVLANE